MEYILANISKCKPTVFNMFTEFKRKRLPCKTIKHLQRTQAKDLEKVSARDCWINEARTGQQATQLRLLGDDNDGELIVNCHHIIKSRRMRWAGACNRNGGKEESI
jgi:hypothetical protein